MSFARLAFRLAPSTARLSLRSARRTISSTTMAQAGPEHMVLKYDYVKDILEKRDPYRADHLAAAQAVADRGNMVIAGALMEPVDGALFIFKGVTKEHIEAFVKNDPYMKAGLVTGYEIRPYMAVVKGTEI